VEISINDLKAAYNRTKLKHAGWTFEQAIGCEMINKCLHRMALNAQAKQHEVKKEYWFNRI
jgi:hypothetical protein